MNEKLETLARFGRYGWEWTISDGVEEWNYRTDEDGTRLYVWLCSKWQLALEAYHLPKVKKSARERIVERFILGKGVIYK